MNNEILIEKIVQSLSLQIEPLQNDNTFQLTGTSRGSPIKLKVKVRKKEQADTYNFITVPKRQLVYTTEKIRSVNSDQTIMSFDMIMHTDQRLPPKKKRNKFFRLLRPGICLRNDDDEKESCQPNEYTNEDRTSRSDVQSKKQLPLSKNDYFDITTAVSKRHHNFLGKCKPGGCLDPPFGEDKYSYTPIKKHLELETSTLTTKTLCLGDDVCTLRQDSLIKSTSSEDKLSWPDNTTDVKIIQKHSKTSSILNIYRAESVNTSLSLTYSNSIITYPPPLTSSENFLNSEKTMQQRVSPHDKSKKSYNEFQTFFISPKQIINQIEHKNSDQEILPDNIARNSILRTFRVQSKTGSEKNYFYSSTYSDKNISVSEIMASEIKQVEKFKELSSTTIKTALTVDEVIGNSEETVSNYIHRDDIILLHKRGSNKESVHQGTPISSATHELISLESTLKSKIIPIKSIDAILNPSIRSSLAESNFNISKILPGPLSQQDKSIIPTFLKDKKSTHNRSSIQRRITKSDSKNLNKTIKSDNDTVLNKEDNLPKPSLEHLAHASLILNKSPDTPSFEGNDKRSSIQIILNKSNSKKCNETVEYDDFIVLSKVDSDINSDYVDNKYKADLNDKKQQISRIERDLEVNNMFGKNIENTKKKPSIHHDEVSNQLTTAHRSVDNENNNVFGKDIKSPTTSISDATSEIKKLSQDFIWKSDDLSSKSILYFFLKSKEFSGSSARKLKDISNFDKKDNNPIKNILAEKLTKYSTDSNAKLVNSEITLQSNTSKVYELNKDTTKNDDNFSNPNVKSYFERPHEKEVSYENDEISDVENLLPIGKSTISQILYSNNKALVTKHEQNQIIKYENENVAQKKPQIISNLTEELNESVKGKCIQALEDFRATSMPVAQQVKDISRIDTISPHYPSADQNSDVSIERDLWNSIEDTLLTEEIVPSADLTKKVLLNLPEMALESDKLQGDFYINSKTDVTNNLPQKLFNDKENEFIGSLIENKISNIILDKPKPSFDKKSNTLAQFFDTNEKSISSNSHVANEDIFKIVPDSNTDMNSNLEKPSKSLISFRNIPYGNTNITEPTYVHDSWSQRISVSSGGEEKNKIVLGRDLKKTIKSDEPHNLINGDAASFILQQKTSNDFAKHNIISEHTNKVSDLKLLPYKHLEMQYQSKSQYLPDLKHKQNQSMDKLESKQKESNVERSGIEKLSTIYDVVAIPNPKKLKHEITALKYRSVLYTSSENTSTKALHNDTVAVDLAFHSYVNSNDKIILKTFNSDNEPQHYSNDRVVIIKSEINLSNNEMNIPIDSENSLFLQIRNVKTMGHTAHNVLKDSDEPILDKKIITNTLHTPQPQKTPNLHYIYENELLPLHNAMKDLKDEIDHLAGYSFILKENLFTRKPILTRLPNINKSCVCLKKIF